MKIGNLGEFGFIDTIKKKFADIDSGLSTGIGDDCAVININDNEDLLISTDLLIEDVHFLKNDIGPERLGYKSLAVNISDIAAMGGTPLYSFLSIAFNKNTDTEFLEGFMEGYHKLSKLFNTQLMGGDTTESLKHLAINVCITGKCAKGKAILRSGAKPGDTIFVTGTLGDSACGLKLILNNLRDSKDFDYLTSKHYCPMPRVEQARFLADTGAVNSMADISDGIASDLLHILEQSNVAAQVNIDLLPLSKSFKKTVNIYGFDSLQLALSGGEDYELIFTADSSKAERLQQIFNQKFGLGITQIGIIVKGEPRIEWFGSGKKIYYNTKGFNHFK